MTLRNRLVKTIVALLAVSALSSMILAQRRPLPPGFIADGVPKMPNPPGPAPKRDLSGAWVGPGTSNKPEPVPPMTPAGQARFKQNKPYPSAGANSAQSELSSNDPFITCDPLGFPRNLLAHAITNRGGTLFASTPDRLL